MFKPPVFIFLNSAKKRILIANYLTIRILFGAANGIRTRDPQLGKLMLYQLSYCRINISKVMP